MKRHLLLFAILLSAAVSCGKSSDPGEKPDPAGEKTAMGKDRPIRMVPPGKKKQVLEPSNNATSPAIPSDLDELVTMLGQPSVIPARTLNDTIKGYGRQAIPRLLKALTDSGNHVRLAAVKLLGEMKEYAREIAPHLIAQLDKEPVMQIRSMTIDALARLELFSEEVQAAFLKSLSDAGWLVRWEAVRGLGSFGEKAKGFVPHLEKKLEDVNNWVQLYAAISLLKILGKSEKASKHLILLTLDADVRFRTNVVAQIESLPAATCPDTAAALLKLVADPDVNVRRVAARALSTCAPELTSTPAVVESLTKAEQDPDHSVKFNATKALGLLKPAVK
ncbi:HEAT repeat domain-containing protein [Myxococcota bacterium]|nr:HEAT repeat domain-containing protein [Myxococcota bacterium]